MTEWRAPFFFHGPRDTSLYFVHYNFCRVHRGLRVTPAMEAGITNTVHDMEWIVSLIDARAPKPGPRGPYRKRQQAA